MRKKSRLLRSSKSVFFKTAFILCILISFSNTKMNAQSTWELVSELSDEFSGTELDALKWNKGLWYSTSGQLAFKESNISISGGNLILTAKQENYNGKAYTYGAVESKFDIPGENSYVEVRAKVLTSAANVLSAIWMQSSPLSSELNPNPEIDIMESFHYYQFSQALHLWHTTNGHTALGGHNWNTGVDISLDYHLYKLERINGKLKFYFDGVLAWETSPADQSFYDLGRHMVLSLEGHLGTPNAAQLPKSFLVDYVRTYVEVGPTNYVGNHSFETGDLTSWGGWGSISSIDNTNPQHGTYAVKLTGNPGASNQTITGLEPNTTYKLTGWSKVPANVSNNEMYMGVKAYVAEEETTERVLVPNTNLYTKNAVTFTTGAINTSARIYLHRAAGDNVVYGDNFRVVKSEIEAITDTFSEMNGSTGETSEDSVLDNDTLDGEMATSQNVTITTISAPNPTTGSITIDESGNIVVAANTTAGTYNYEYQICDADIPTKCSSIISTIEITDGSLGVVKEQLLKGLSIYPNPVINGSILNVEYNNEITNEKLRISLINILGQELITKSYNLKRGFNKLGLEIESINEGLYLLRCSVNNKETTRKIVITH